MQMIKVESTDLEYVGYESTTKTMRIMFKEGIYDYENVPEKFFIALLNAHSKGKFFHAEIKNKFSFSKVK